MRRHQLKKNIGVQVVGSETIGEYRLIGFNDLRTTVELDLGISARIGLYRPPADPVGTARHLSRKSIYPRINRARVANIWNGRILTVKMRISLFVGRDKWSCSRQSLLRA